MTGDSRVTRRDKQEMANGMADSRGDSDVAKGFFLARVVPSSRRATAFYDRHIHVEVYYPPLASYVTPRRSSPHGLDILELCICGLRGMICTP